MKPVNLSSIEKFIERVKIAEKTYQKTLMLDIYDATNLRETLEQLTLRLLEKNLNTPSAMPTNSTTKINADGGKF